MIEKRRFTRVPYASNATITYQKGRLPTSIKDISLRGIGVDCSLCETIPLYTPLSVVIENKDMRMTAQGKPVFRNGSQLGIKFTGIGESSLNNLILLMRKNCKKGSDLDNEINKLVLRVKS
jgi:hypothetical protein